MLSTLSQGSPAIIVFLCLCLVLVLAFEFSNGFHDTANAVATVIYTNSLKPVPAVILSGTMNFLGVLVGGIAVAYALVELIPADVVSPPNGGVAVGMLASLFIAALAWNVGTWYFGIPNSSSHALIGSLIGIAIEYSLRSAHNLHSGVDWHQVKNVLSALLFSPLMGFVLAFALFRLVRLLIKDRRIFEPPQGDQPPIGWMRAILIFTCTAVSFAHGTNDGQKTIGLIMLTIIGLMPSAYAINRDMKPEAITAVAHDMRSAGEFIERFGGDKKEDGVREARTLAGRFSSIQSVDQIPAGERAGVRNDFNHLLAQLKSAAGSPNASKEDKKAGKALHDRLMRSVEYAPWWVRILSAACLGLGTMVGYRRIVKTLGERLGKQHLVPAQGASAELVAAALISSAGFTGLPVSTTHVVTGGIAGTMVGSGAGLQKSTVWQIAAAWVLTLPATMLLSAGLFYLLS